MITGFYVKNSVDTWWEDIRHYSSYSWVFRKSGGYCITFTYAPR